MILIELLKKLYPTSYLKVFEQVNELIIKNKTNNKSEWLTEKDVILITYGDSIKSQNQKPLITLKNFLNHYTNDEITNIHLLPMYPYTSDDGFSVTDYEEINPELGNWKDIRLLSKSYGLMFDAVINHISKSSQWFQGYLKGEEKYKQYFIECDPTLDYSDVIRPRALPLYYPFPTSEGMKYLWATFSEDQIDLNYQNPDVLIRILEILIKYAKNGARFIRFDAVGFLWKKIGTTSIHLEETHVILQIMRYVLDETVPGTIIISETNVPHYENISYFGDGYNEAHMVYQFPLPPLTLFSFVTGNARKLLDWTNHLKATRLTDSTSYFNFLASHDGIGMRPVEDLLTEDEKQQLIDHVILNGGKISYKNNKDFSVTPYELNINFQDAVANKDDQQDIRISKFIASQVILLSFIGVPGIYIHSLLGSRNDYKGLESSKINRRINREKLDYGDIISDLKDSSTTRYKVFYKYLELIGIRKKYSAFSPTAKQEVIYIDDRVFSILRFNEKNNQKILVLVNVSNDIIKINHQMSGYDVIHDEIINRDTVLESYQYRWILINE